MTNRSRSCIIAFACLVACPAYADSQYDWFPTGTSGALEDPNNYRLASTGDASVPTAPPDASSTIAFSNPSVTSTVMLANSNDTVGNLLAQTGQNLIDLQGYTLSLANVSLTGSNTSLTQLTLANGSLNASNVVIGTFSTLSLSNISATASQSTTITGTFNLVGDYATGSLNAANATAFNFTSGNLSINGGIYAPLQANQALASGASANQFSNFTSSAVLSGTPGSSGTPTIFLQNGASATMTAVSGGSNDWFIGLNGGRGAVAAAGANVTLSTSGIFFIGAGATGSGSTFIPSSGSISLAAGAVANAVVTNVGQYGGAGTITIDGANTTLRNTSNFFVGESAFSDNGTYRPSHGNLSITNGATATATNSIVIGHAGGVGVAVVDGTGSTLHAAAIHIGDNFIGSPTPRAFGVGSLSITHGANVGSSADLIIGETGGTGTVTVDGLGSTLQSTNGQLIIGDGKANTSPATPGNGTLNLQNGGTATSFTNTYIGNAFGTGSVTVGNGNATSTLAVGANLTLFQFTKSASLSINSGGLVTVANTTQTQSGASPVSLSINGGTLQTGALLLGSASQFHWTAGTLAITGTNGFSSDVLGPSPTLSANQTLRVSSTLSIPANATLSLTGGTAITSQLSLAGTSGAYTSALSISNASAVIVEPTTNRAAIIATLQDELLYGQTHTTGITAASLPANYALALLDNATTQFATFGGQPVDLNSVLLAPEVLGDANIDGHVDLTDLNTVLNHLGATTANWTDGNFDGAPTIDLTDLNDVLNNLGVTYANSSSVLAAEALLTNASAPTPEPASLAFLPAALALLLRKRPAVRAHTRSL